ncbi:uncharacterized protein LOC135685140 isoform X2 [Rhopilema esculentum]|uniref:uncharacterized protein LOC135685140 isoform X2 n=1 Tax=Rhopilema esculentum TaxID=499914 RepID=UPI0031CEADA2
MKDSKNDMADTKSDNPPDVVQDAPTGKSSGEDDGGNATASPASSPTEGKSDNYFSRKIGSVLNRSLRKFKKSGSQEKAESEKQNGHDSEDHSPTSKSPQKSPRSPRTPKTPDGTKQSKFQRIFRSSKRTKSADYVENEAASTSNILDSDKEPVKEKHTPLTKYGEQKQIVVDGKAMTEIEVTGEKQQETLPETRRHRRISKSRRKAEFEGDELKVQCRDLNPVDYEGWLYKKSGGTMLSTVVWKQCWVVLKHGILYLYKTSFDIAAQHAYSVRNFSVAPVEEKKKFTFKLVPKNVPPEALQDAKGVVFSCESNADVERWCDVLNKAALGFIIQPSPRPEKEPVRRRCQSSAVRRHKPNANGVTGHRARSTTFTGETTGLPSTFNRHGGAPRVRKISGSGSSSVLAVGNMFLAIDDPADKKRKSNSDLSSIVYKEQLVQDNNTSPNTKQQIAATTAEEDDEVRMQVKKEVERINKHSKPTKPVEGKGQTVASAKKADKIRQEIMNLKEIESQRVNSQEEEGQDADSDEREVIESENETKEEQTEATEDQTESTESPTESTEGQTEGTEHQTEPTEDPTEGTEGQTGSEAQTDDNKDQDILETSNTYISKRIDTKNDKVEADQDFHEDAFAEIQKTIEVDSSAEDQETDAKTAYHFPGDSDMKEVEVEEVPGDAVLVSHNISVEKDPDSGIAVEDYLRQLETEQHDLPVEEYLKHMSGTEADKSLGELQSEDAKDILKVESCQGQSDDHVAVEEDEDDNNDQQEDSSEFEDDETDEENEPEDRPKGMIPAKQQRMLIDAVLSLDYPSDSESEPEDDEEICHFAKIERRSLEINEGKVTKQTEDDDVIISAPPGFGDEEATHQGHLKVKDHDVQYGATTEGKSVVFHTYMKTDGDRTNIDLKAPEEMETVEATTSDDIYPEEIGFNEGNFEEKEFQEESRYEATDGKEAGNEIDALLTSRNDPQLEFEEIKKQEATLSKPTYDKFDDTPVLVIDLESRNNELSGDQIYDGDYMHTQGESSVLISMIGSSRASNASEEDSLDGDNCLREKQSDQEASRTRVTFLSPLHDEHRGTVAKESDCCEDDTSTSEDETAIDEIDSAEEEVHSKATVKIVKVCVTQRGNDSGDQRRPIGAKPAHESSV